MSVKDEVLRYPFGEATYGLEDVIHLPEGIYGFESYRRYLLITRDDYLPFRWLVCIDKPELIFTVIDPFLVCPDYDPMIPLSDSDSRFWVFVAVDETTKTVTANLRAPLVLTGDGRRAEQVISPVTTYALRHRIGS